MTCQYCGAGLAEDDLTRTCTTAVGTNDEGEPEEITRLTSRGACATCGTLNREEHDLNEAFLDYSETYEDYYQAISDIYAGGEPFRGEEASNSNRR